MASAGARAYNGESEGGAEPPVGFRAQPHVRGSGGEALLKPKSFLNWNVQRRGKCVPFSALSVLRTLEVDYSV